MSDFNIQFEEQAQVITLEFEQAGGGAVKSVNGKTGVVVLDAEDVGAYTKPSGGIPKTDLASSVQTSLGKADSAYQKPSGGIPASDMASGAIPTVDNTLTTAGAAADAKKVGDEISDLKEDLQEITSATATKKNGTVLNLYTTGISANLTTDGTKTYISGKNMFYAEPRVYDRTAYGFGKLTAYANGEFHIDGGTATAAINYYFTIPAGNGVAYDYGYLLKAGDYTFSLTDKSTGEIYSPGSGVGGYGFFYWETDDLSTRLNYQRNLGNGSFSVTMPKDFIIIPFIHYDANVAVSETTIQIQIERANTATAFEEANISVVTNTEATITLNDRITNIWTNGTYVQTELSEIGVINNQYRAGDARRYGIFPDGVTNWENLGYIANAIANSINLGLEIYFPDGYYATQINIGRSNVQMRFGENAEFGGLIHIVSPYSQHQTGEHPIKNITLRGNLQTYSRYGQTDTENVYVERIHLLSDDKKNIDYGIVGGGAHIYWGNNGFWCNEIVVDDNDNTAHTTDAAISIDGFGNNPKNFHIGKIHIKDSSVHGLYLTGSGHWIGEVTVDAFGYGTYSGSGLQDSNGLEQSKELCGVWLNRVYDCYIGKINVNQASSETRSNAKYSVRVDETGIASYGVISIDEITAYNVKNSNRGVTIGDLNYDPPRCYGNIGSVLVKGVGNGETNYGLLTVTANTAVNIVSYYAIARGNRPAIINNSSVSQVGLSVVV